MLRIGKNLKRLRIKNEQTQEQVAEALGVSAQAVSRWETGSTYPDITLLPSIANYFDVTVDELLGVDIEKKQEEIDKILAYNSELHRQGSVDESIAFLREKSRQYPSCAEITYQLANSLHMKSCTVNSCQGGEKTAEEIISLCSKAVDIAKSMPTVWTGSEVLLAHSLPYKDRVRQQQYNLLTFLDLSILNLKHLSRNMETAEESIALLDKAAQLADILTGDDHKFYNVRIAECCLLAAMYYCTMKKVDEAFEKLELSLKYTSMYENRPKHSKYDVFWLSAIEDDKAKAAKNKEGTFYRILLEKIAGERFAVLHDTKRYRAFVERIEEAERNSAAHTAH